MSTKPISGKRLAFAVSVLVAAQAAMGFAGSVRQPGIDVSHFQDTIDWSQVKNDGVEFAFVKATEGENTVDAQFATNMQGATANGILAGAYHFAHPELSGHTPQVEADHFLATAQPYITDGYLPPVLDLETGGGVTIYGASTLSDWVNDFCADIRAATGGIDPIIYCSSQYADQYLDSSVTVHKLWLQNYGGVNPDSSTLADGDSVCGVWGAGNWSFFQYSDTGTENGIDDAVDLDSFNGSQSQLQAMEVIPEPTELAALGLLSVAMLLRVRRPIATS